MISIIIPVYNAELYIERCLDSVLEQTFNDYEVIIVNDGSTDSSPEILKKYESQNEKIKVISQENLKLGAARNTGLKNATGEYITFIDADDYVHRDYLRILYENLVNFQADVSICGFYRSSEDIFHATDISENLPCTRTNIEAMYECCAINKTTITTAWGKLYKRELFYGIWYPEEGRIHEDLATTHKILYRAHCIVTTQLKLYCYFNTPQSLVHGKYSYRSFYSENTAQDERLLFFEDIGIDNLIKKNMIAVERNRITNYCRGLLYLPEYKNECNMLKGKFDETFCDLKDRYKIGLVDFLIFKGFQLFPSLYVHLLYNIYSFFNKININGIHSQLETRNQK